MAYFNSVVVMLLYALEEMLAQFSAFVLRLMTGVVGTPAK
jgi:hypothetical protein